MEYLKDEIKASILQVSPCLEETKLLDELCREIYGKMLTMVENEYNKVRKKTYEEGRKKGYNEGFSEGKRRGRILG